MSNFYSDSKFGVIQTQWFGLTRKAGGDSAAGITLGTKGTTIAITTPTRWYPKGPITMVRAGYRVLATLNAASKSMRDLVIKTRGASASIAARVQSASCTVAQYAVNSTSTFTVAQVKAGEYVTMKWSSGKTIVATTGLNTGTVQSGTVLGTVAAFIDWVPTYDASGKWDS